jgi:transcriptional regulator with XRE-family HTH domain
MGMHLLEQRELAQAVGMTKQGIWQIVSARNMPRWENVAKLAEVFGVETRDLIGDAEAAVLAGARAFPHAPIRRQLEDPEHRRPASE